MIILMIGYAAAKDILTWRSGQSNILQPSSVLGKHELNNNSNNNHNKLNLSIKRNRLI